MAKLSDLKNEQYQRDKLNVLEWMKKYCHGIRKARTRKDILPFILTHKNPIETRDRYFREIVSELRHEDHIGSTSSDGYWFIPLSTNDQAEIEAALRSVSERESRAMNEIEDCKRQRQMLEARQQPGLFERAG